VAELARLHGGSVAAQSVLGEGSAISVTIPQGAAHRPPDLIQGNAMAQSSAIAASAFVSEALRWLPGEESLPTESSDPGLWHQDPNSSAETRSTILLADDNSDMRDYVGRLLRAHYDVKVVGDGKAALDAIRTLRPDLVLSDVMMPRLDGFGLLRELRTDKDLRDIPVILLSARAGEEASVEGQMPGPTITSSSRSAPANCWHGCGLTSIWPNCGASHCALNRNCARKPNWRGNAPK